MKRQVQFSTLIKLIANKRPVAFVGLGMALFSLFAIIPMALIISTSADEPYESYDSEKILREGVEKTATITDISDVTNVTVNGEHPRLIRYQYQHENQTLADKFQTFDLDAVAGYAIGDEIAIKSNGTQSVITGIEPYRFPFWLLYLIPFTLFMIGSILLTIAAVPALKILNLYKNGIVKDAEVMAITRNSGMPITNIGQNILIDYHYIARGGKKLFGSASTTDISYLHENKPGSTVKIFVSETDEGKSTLVPRLESAKNNWNI